MSFAPQHIAGATTHARRGSVHNAFRYGVDYVLIDPEAPSPVRLFSRNRFNLASVHDKNHGGAPKNGCGLPWARDVFRDAGLANTRAPAHPAQLSGLCLQPCELLAGL